TPQQRKALSGKMGAEVQALQFATVASETGWQPPFIGPIVTVHAALMHTGKVLFIAGSVTDMRIFEQVCPNDHTTEITSCPANPNDTSVCPPWGLTDGAAVWDPVNNTFSRPAIPLDNSGKPLD